MLGRVPVCVGDGGFLTYTGYEACGVLDTRNVVWCGVGRVVVGGSCVSCVLFTCATAFSVHIFNTN